MHRRHTVGVLALLVVSCLFIGVSWRHAAAEPESVTVFAAASLTDVIGQLGEDFKAQGMGSVTGSYASSSTLARQIEHGAPANIFISADEAWMSYLAGHGLIDETSRFILAGNRLVLIAPAESSLKVDIKAGTRLSELLKESRLATGDPDHVPAGKYAKEALQKLGMWSDIEPKLARGDNVRAALALVGRGEAALGIVYSTDALASTKVKVVGIFPEDSHPPVVYPAALVAGRETPAARRFLEHLKSREAKALLERYGFTVK